jgi:hypothetical protein
VQGHQAVRVQLDGHQGRRLVQEDIPQRRQ